MNLYTKKFSPHYMVNIIQVICYIVSSIFFIHKIRFSSSNNNKLAFHIYHLPKTSSQNPLIQSRQILIKGLENKLLRKQVISLLNLNNQIKHTLSSKDLQIWVRKLKRSGFFSSIKVKYHLDQGHQRIFIYLTPNPVLKEIKIINLRQKLIPKSHIKKIFQYNVGLPVNPNKLDKQIELIKKWYTEQGYLKARCHLRYAIIDNHCIEIDIDEYLIDKIHLIVLQNSLNLLPSINLNYWLGKILHINLYEPLNLIELDIRLQELQKNNIIQYSYYDIREDHHRELFIYLQPLNKRSTHIFSKQKIVTDNFLESLVSLFNYSFSLPILDKDFSVFVISKIYKYYAYLVNFVNLNNAVYYKMCQHDFMFYHSFLKTLFVPYNSSRNSWYIKNPILMLNNNFGLRYFIRYLDKYNSNMSINLILATVGPLTDCKYNIPHLKLIQSLTTSVIIKISKGISIYKQYSNYIRMNYDYDTLIYPKNSLIQQNNIRMKVQHYLSDHTNLYNHIIIHNLVYKSLLFKTSVRLQKLYNYNISSQGYHSFIRNQIYNFHIFTKYKLGFVIPLSKEHNRIINNDKYNIEITSLIATTKINYDLNIIVHKIKHNLQKKINVQNQTLTIYCSLISLIGKQKYLPLPEKLITIGPDIIRGYIKDYHDFPLSLQNYKLEYSINRTSRRILYLFIDYLSHKYENNHIIIGLTNDYINTSLKVSYGIGLQIMTPIKQIPPLHVEYGYNIAHGQCLHLRVHQGH